MKKYLRALLGLTVSEFEELLAVLEDTYGITINNPKLEVEKNVKVLTLKKKDETPLEEKNFIKKSVKVKNKPFIPKTIGKPQKKKG